MTASHDLSALGYHSLCVESVIEETHDARSIVFSIPESLKTVYQYKPGQFLTLRLPWEGESLLRCYSMSSTPEQDAMPRVTVKRVQDGRASNWLCDQIKVGDRIDVMRPAGVFVPRTFEGDFLLCAGGSGITPVYSILRAVLAQGQGRIRLIYANRDEASVIFKAELKALAKAYPDRLEVIHLLDSVQGIPSEALLTRLAEPMATAQVFICGPAPFMSAMESALSHTAIDPDKIHVERFISLNQDAPDPEVKAALQANASFEQAQVSIEIDGAVHELLCRADETVLDAAERSGVSLPYSCKIGMCASCICEVKEGEVELLLNEVLDARDLAKSRTLSCQAVPKTAKLRLRYT